jgi:hypothetical protein
MFKLIVLLAIRGMKFTFKYLEERNIINSILEMRNNKKYISGKDAKPKETQLQQKFIKLVNKIRNQTLYFWK